MIVTLANYLLSSSINNCNRETSKLMRGSLINSIPNSELVFDILLRSCKVTFLYTVFKYNNRVKDYKSNK